jgi:hypothetical protein
MFGSKYNKDLPYTYRATYQIFEDSDEFTRYWFGDTFCSVCNHLRNSAVRPVGVTIYECYTGGDVEMPKESYTDKNGEWLLRDNLCHAHIRYGSAGAFDNCKFIDRDKYKVI